MAKPKNAETLAEKEDESGNIRSEENLYMNGPEIYAFTLRAVPQLINETLAQTGPHDGRNRLRRTTPGKQTRPNLAQRQTRHPDEKFCIDVEELGNTVSSTIPIAIKRAMARVPEKLKPGAKILIAGFGVGYSWGGTVITMN